MRIILEDTCSEVKKRTVAELDYDDVTVSDVMEMVRSVLVGYGYHPDNIAEYIPYV